MGFQLPTLNWWFAGFLSIKTVWFSGCRWPQEHHHATTDGTSFAGAWQVIGSFGPGSPWGVSCSRGLAGRMRGRRMDGSSCVFFRSFLRVAGLFFSESINFREGQLQFLLYSLCFGMTALEQMPSQRKERFFFNFEPLFSKSSVTRLIMLMDANGGVIQTSRCRASERVKQTDCKLHQLVTVASWNSTI